jgi:hypothetical protein
MSKFSNRRLSTKHTLQLKSVTTKEANFRRSQVTYKFPKELILYESEKYMPLLKEHFKLDFTNQTIECQMTAHNNGDYVCEPRQLRQLDYTCNG